MPAAPSSRPAEPNSDFACRIWDYRGQDERKALRRQRLSARCQFQQLDMRGDNETLYSRARGERTSSKNCGTGSKRISAPICFNACSVRLIAFSARRQLASLDGSASNAASSLPFSSPSRLARR